MRSKRNRNSGQSISEYAAVLAFVACIIAFFFGVANGTLFTGITGAYSTTNSVLGNLNSYTPGP